MAMVTFESPQEDPSELSNLSNKELVQCAEELFLTLDREDSREVAYE